MFDIHRFSEHQPARVALPTAESGADRARLEPGELADLVEAARKGDESAWEELYRALYPRLMAYARRRVEPEAAKDAVAETMARAVGSISRFSWRGSGFEGWLFAILHHVITDKHRRRARDRHLDQINPVAGADPASSVLEDEDVRVIRAAFARIPAADQQILSLRCVAGLSADAVGEVLGKRPGAVRMAQSRALGRLRAIFEEMSS